MKSFLSRFYASLKGDIMNIEDRTLEVIRRELAAAKEAHNLAIGVVHTSADLVHKLTA